MLLKNKPEKRPGRKIILALGIFLLFILLVFISVFFSQKPQDIRKEAADIAPRITPPIPPLPEYAKGEVLIKFKTSALGAGGQNAKIQIKPEKADQGIDFDKQAVDFSNLDENSLPPSLKNLKQKYKFSKIEKVFKGATDPKTELAKFKQKFGKEITEGKRSINEEGVLKIDLSRTYKISFDKSISVEQMIQDLSPENNPEIEYAEPNYLLKADVVPNDPDFPKLWGLSNAGQTGGKADADIHAAKAWDITTGNENIVVGIIDSGIDYNHPDLINNIWININEIPDNGIDDDGNGFIDDVHGWNFVYNNNNPMDDAGHGTHVAGTIGAVANNNIGITGVAWKVKLLPIKFLDQNGSGYTDDAARAIYYAILMGARLTNNSWGGGDFSQTLYEAIAQAGTTDQLFIAAAGNGGTDGIGDDNDRYAHYPSSYDLPNIIAVAATDHNDQLASFSNYGFSSVDIAAPGKDIYSALPNNSYGLLSGTSMATPHISGIAGLTYSKDPSLSALEVKTLIISSSDKITFAKPIRSGRANVDNIIKTTAIPPVGEIIIPEPNKYYGGLIKIIGTVGGRSFSSYKIEMGQGNNPSSWITTGISLTNSGTAPITSEMLGTGTTSSYQKGLWTLKLTVNGNNGTISENQIQFNIDPNIKDGWPQEIDVASSGNIDQSTLLASDINNDGKKEIIAGSYSGNVYVWNPNGSLLNANWPKYLGGNMAGNSAKVMATADLNRDGKKEIIIKAYRYHCPGYVCTETNDLHLLNENALEVNSAWPKIGDYTNPVITDINNDGSEEIISYNLSDSKLHIFNNEGNDMSIALSSGGSDFISIGDIDGNGKKEIVFAVENSLVVYRNDGTLFWSRNFDAGYVSWAKPTLADINNDGQLEIITPAGPAAVGLSIWKGKIWIFKSDGSNLPGWPQSQYIEEGNCNRSAVAVGDIDKDGSVELVWGTDHGRVMIFDVKGEVINILYGDSVYSNFNRGLALADIDNDSYSDILAGASREHYGSGAFFAWDYRGNPISGWPKSILTFSTPQVTDIDQDGKIDIITYGKETLSQSPDKIYVWETNSNLNQNYLDWPMYGHNEYRTSSWVNLRPPQPTPTPTPIPSPTSAPTPTPPANSGKALYFKFEEWNNYVMIPDHSLYKIGNEMTIELWVRPEINVDTNTILGKFFSDYHDYIFNLQTDNFDYQPNRSKVRFFLKTTNGNLFLSSNQLVSDDGSTWTHVAITKNGNEMKLFINGQHEDTQTITGSILDTNEAILSLGAFLNRYSITTSFFGTVDDLRISNSARDISNNWNSGYYFQPLEVDQNTVGLWRFENNLEDSSTNRNTGVAIGSPNYTDGRVPFSPPIPTLTPTPTTPPTAVLLFSGKVSFEGRDAPGTSRWAEKLILTSYAQGTTILLNKTSATTETGGNFDAYPDLPGPGYYDLVIKGEHSLSRKKTGLVDWSGPPEQVDFQTLLEGDVNGDDMINSTDLALLQLSLGKNAGQDGYNTYADLNNDGTVDIKDKNLLMGNFCIKGEGLTSTPPPCTLPSPTLHKLYLPLVP